VAVEKVGLFEKSRKSGDRKCPGDWEKSFVELPDAKQFLRNRSERVFQQPLLFSGPTRRHQHLDGPTLEWEAVIPDSANREGEFQLVVQPSLLTAGPSHLAYA